jgi:hypothetical protein
MKSLLIALSLSVISFSSFADSILVDSVRLQNCGGEVQLRSSIDREGVERYSLKFVGVENCSNVRLGGRHYRLINEGLFENGTFPLTNEAVKVAYILPSFLKQGFGVNMTSNSGNTQDYVIIQLRTAQPQAQPGYESSESN